MMKDTRMEETVSKMGRVLNRGRVDSVKRRHYSNLFAFNVTVILVEVGSLLFR